MSPGIPAEVSSKPRFLFVFPVASNTRSYYYYTHSPTTTTTHTHARTLALKHTHTIVAPLCAGGKDERLVFVPAGSPWVSWPSRCSLGVSIHWPLVLRGERQWPFANSFYDSILRFFHSQAAVANRCFDTQRQSMYR